MDAQLSLFGGPLPDRATVDRLNPVFFAFVVSEGDRARVWERAAGLREAHGLTGSVRPAATLHVSLFGIGYRQSLPEERLAEVIDAGYATRFMPFEVEFTEVLSLGKAKVGVAPVVLRCGEGVEGIEHLAGRIGEQLRARGPARRIKPLVTPHLTLIYDAGRVPPTPLAPPLRVTVGGFALVQSLYGRGRYETLHSWPRRD